jgi:hypothetical protein
MAERADRGQGVERISDLRDCATAFECRDRLPELAAWMSDDLLKQVRIWKGPRFEPGQLYFDLDNPERGPFVATGDEAPITDHTYACRAEVSEEAWAQLATWRQPVSEEQAEAIAIQARELGTERPHTAGGEAAVRRPGAGA